MASRNSVSSGCSSSEWKRRDPCSDKQWQMRNYEPKSHDSGGNATDSHHEPAGTDSFCPALMNVGVEPDNYATCINRKYSRRYLAGINEIVSVPADVHCSFEFAEKAALRLPGDPVRETPLYLQALVTLHPGINRREHVARISGNGSGCRGETGTCDLGYEATFFGNIDAR